MNLRSALVSLSVLAALGVAVPGEVDAAPGQRVNLSPWISPPAALSSSGDFATDAFSDPWDFSNAEDVIPIDEVGTQDTLGVSLANGMLTASTQPGSTIRLLFDWPGVLPWGRDGWANPIDAGRYTQATFRICVEMQGLAMALRFENAFGQEGVLPFTPPVGCSTQHFDLVQPANFPFAGYQGPWAGPVVRLEVFRGGGAGGAAAAVQLDWFRLHRADAPKEPPAGVPVPRVITPNVEGGADFASTVRANPWDFNDLADLAGVNQLANLSLGAGGMTGTTVGNDPFVELALGSAVNTDRYRRLTIDACYDGGFSLADAPGGGMNGRMAWFRSNPWGWSETQDFVVFPGCHRMTLDLATTGPASVHDESTRLVSGWRGIRPERLRFDLNEDRGARNFSLREIRLADDAAFSTSYPIQFTDVAAAPNTVADIYVTTVRGAFDGVRIARNVKVSAGTNTFTWNGTNDVGQPMANSTYWVYVVMRSGVSTGTGYSTGPVRLERPVPSSPSYFVSLPPARLLDTRTGEGGNLSALGPQTFTELDVTGVGGVPEGGVSAVVLNVTVDGPTTPGYITAWPSGEPQPTVSNLNFVPGQTVANLVTVKVGANGRVNLLNSTGDTNVIADVVGYYTPGRPAVGGLFTPVTPARLLDTRTGVGRNGAVNAVAGGSSIDAQVTGIGGVPSSGVDAVALNVTIDQPTTSGFVTTWPTGLPRPNASTHNFVPGLTVANLVLAKVGAGGHVSLFNSSGATHLLADVVGYFSASGGTFVPVAPERLIDTRNGTGTPAARLGQGATLDVSLADGTPVPPTATGVIVNITAADSDAPSFLTAWPMGAPMPLASTSNPRPFVPVPNQAYLKLGDGGRLQLYNNTGSTDVIVDIFGYVL